jgi:hypothetical protein
VALNYFITARASIMVASCLELIKLVMVAVGGRVTGMYLTRLNSCCLVIVVEVAKVTEIYLTRYNSCCCLTGNSEVQCIYSVVGLCEDLT